MYQWVLFVEIELWQQAILVVGICTLHSFELEKSSNVWFFKKFVILETHIPTFFAITTYSYLPFLLNNSKMVAEFLKWFQEGTLCSQFMRFRIMRFSIYAVLENGPNSCFMLQYSQIMRFLVKIIVYKILLIFFLHLCYSCIMRFLLGNKKRINGELSVCQLFILVLSYFG